MSNVQFKALKAKIKAKKEQHKDYLCKGSNEFFIAKKEYDDARKHVSDLKSWIKVYVVDNYKYGNDTELMVKAVKVLKEDLPEAIKNEKEATKRFVDVINKPNERIPDDIKTVVVLHYIKNFFGRGINTLDGQYGDTPLMEAITNLDFVSMHMVVEYYPLFVTNQTHQGNDNNKHNIFDINAKDVNGCTVLNHAVRMEASELELASLFRFLFHNNANFDATDQYGMTTLHWAICFGRADLVTCLVESCNADINRMDPLGQSPLFFAITHYLKYSNLTWFVSMAKYYRIIGYLLEKGANNRFYMLHRPDPDLRADEPQLFELCTNWNEYIHHNGRTVIAKISDWGCKLVPVDSNNEGQFLLHLVRLGPPPDPFVWRFHPTVPLFND